MPFEFGPEPRPRIAVIGGGITGMAAARELAATHHVTLMEERARLGGHARTKIAGKNGDQPVDTGFIVYNKVNYPHMCAMFEELGVPTKKSLMTFGVSLEGGKIEYALHNLNAIKHVPFHPRLIAMFRDILRFNKHAEAAVTGPEMTLGELIETLGLSTHFRDFYILPFSGAIWSTSLAEMLDFPAEALMRFFRNHHLLNVWGQHQWHTVDGGSIEYVTRLEADLRQKRVEIRLSAGVQAVRREPYGAMVKCEGGDWEFFDDVLMACHSDQTLSLLSDPSELEVELLSAIRYQPNRAVLHADASVMPKRRGCWASWVYVSDKTVSSDPVGVSYWMNSLQSIPNDDPIFQSLNPSKPIRDELIYEETSFSHPVFDRAALDAQTRFAALQGQNQTYFAGAWLRNGFHEDGMATGIEAARHAIAKMKQNAEQAA